MRAPLALVLAGSALLAGCRTTLPAAIVTGISVLDSNTQTLGTDFQRLLSGAPVDSRTRSRDLQLVVENARLARRLKDWSLNHAK